MGDRSYLSIGEVLSLLQPEFDDLTISKIRFLESQGLLEPERTPSGYRKFYESDVERLRWILRQQREQYLPLKVIRGKLGDPDDADPAGAEGAGPTDVPADPTGADPQPGRPASGAAPAPAATEALDPTPARPDSGASRPSVTGGGPRPGPDGPDPLAPPRTGVSLTAEELCAAAGLDRSGLAELERYGLVVAHPSGSTAYYDEEALTVAQLSARFMGHGVEARHLRMYKTAAEREAGVFEQLVMPLLRQRNPRARREAMERLSEVAGLGRDLRAAMLRIALRDELG